MSPILRAAASSEKRLGIRRAAREASSSRSTGFRTSIRNTSASPAASPGSKSMPVSPCATSSGLPPTREATTEHPHAMASMSELESASESDGSTNMSMACSQAATRAVAGSKTQSGRTPSAMARFCRSARRGPLPTIANFMPDTSPRTAVNASSKVSSPFSGRRPHTTPTTRAASRKASGRAPRRGRNARVSTPL